MSRSDIVIRLKTQADVLDLVINWEAAFWYMYGRGAVSEEIMLDALRYSVDLPRLSDVSERENKNDRSDPGSTKLTEA